MNYFILIIIGVAGVALGVYMAKRGVRAPQGGNTQSAVNEGRVVAKQMALERVFSEIQKKGSITNDEVQALLSVSDATAERYLQELEAAGGISQVGAGGKGVSYRIKE
ncbi:MAG: winged helix-turn-helix transcriptional regulator [Candidatus Paceibacterota bacterium]|jgi:predicted HTH transcriptional regulator